jgi:hypothetical protein
MKLKSLLRLAGVALALAGCSTPTRVDHGPIQGHTFSFITAGARTAPSNTDTRAAVHQLIQDAITKNLASHGITKTDAGPDLQVGYLVIIGNNVYTETINDYFGYTDAANALQDKAHSAYTDSDRRNQFEAGTLVIDIVDAHSSKLLKRGYATRSTLRNVPEDARAAKVQEIVDVIFRDLWGG